MIDYIMFRIHCLLSKIESGSNNYKLKKAKVKLGKNVILGHRTRLNIEHNSLAIGEYTYINDAHIVSTHEFPITIGTSCAIGYRVSIKATTHLKEKYWPCEESPPLMGGAPIVIGDRVWIGDGVFIKAGVVIGNDVIIGANSVVTKDVASGMIVAGVPAKVLINA